MRFPSKRVLQCGRCGQEVATRTARWWGDDDYVELLHEFFALEAELQETRRLLLREQIAHADARGDLQRIREFSDEHLWPLAQAQLRVLVALHPESAEAETTPP